MKCGKHSRAAAWAGSEGGGKGGCDSSATNQLLADQVVVRAMCGLPWLLICLATVACLVG